MRHVYNAWFMLLAGCATPVSSVPALGWDDALYDHALQFHDDMAVRGVDVAIGQVVTLIVSDRDVDACEDWLDSLAGCCEFTEGTRGIRGAVYVRSGLTPEYTRTVVYHELTHCTTGLNHSSGEQDIMNETVPWIGDNEWEAALDTLAAFIGEGLQLRATIKEVRE